MPFLEVDLEDSDAQVGARFVDFSGAATAKGTLGGVEGKEIVLDGANVNQAREQKVR